MPSDELSDRFVFLIALSIRAVVGAWSSFMARTLIMTVAQELIFSLARCRAG
jgi:hypothetical protein